MTRALSLTIVAALTFSAVAPAQSPQFRWQNGQVLTYRVSQTTTAVETVKDGTLSTTTQLDLVKRWQVVAVDAAGTATLQMTLTSLRMETKPPSGDALLFDSANLAKSHEQLRDEMQKYIGPPLTVVRLDGRGQLVEVKESKFGPASRLQSELPFKLILPGASLSAGQTWDRQYQIKLEPPQGTGETYDAVQHYTCKGLANGLATVQVATELKTQPDSAADRLPLLPLLSAGEIHFDVANGRLRGVRYRYTTELPEHRGEGSKYQFQTAYNEDLVEIK
jgi:hypothetical protein